MINDNTIFPFLHDDLSFRQKHRHTNTHTFIKTKASNVKKTGVLKTHAHT